MSAKVFSRFRHLPTELRRKIWSTSIPGRRVYEMDVPLADNHDTFPRGADRELCVSPADEFSSQFPAALHVCGESRDVVQNSHPYLTSIYGTGEIPETDEDGASYPPWMAWNANLPVRLRKGLDIVHLHWNKEYERHEWLTAAPNPLPSFRWLANQAAAASVSAELLLRFGTREPWPLDTSIGPGEVKYFSPHVLYYVVLSIVEMHMSDEEAVQAKVFGPLGEERIQLVDPRDTAAVARFRDAWRRHRSPSEEPDVADFFSRATSPDSAEAYCAQVEQWRQNLEKLWLWRKCVALKVPIEVCNAIWPDPTRPAGAPFTFPFPSFPPQRIDWTLRNLNREHPWVQTQLGLMPRFEPALMFRHCNNMCGLPSQPTPEGRES